MAIKGKGKSASFMGWALMGVGLLVLGGTAVFWVITRLPDQIAIQNLPTPAAITQSPTTLPSEIPLIDSPAAVPPTPPATPVPTFEPAPLQQLPSVATLSEAPTQLREPILGQPSRIVIPRIGIDAPVRDVGLSSLYDDSQGGDVFYQWQVPHEYAAGWHHNSAPLGQVGNTVLNGHQNVFGEVFRDLEELAVGDGLILYDGETSYIYRITQREIFLERGQSAAVRAANAGWIESTTDERITLVTCWPYSDNSHRLIIVAEPVKSADG